MGGDAQRTIRYMYDLIKPDTMQMLGLLGAPQITEPERKRMQELLARMQTPAAFREIRGPMNLHMLRNAQNHQNTFPAPKYFREFQAVNDVYTMQQEFAKALMGLMNTE